MAYLEIYKLTTDVLLVLSLAWFLLRLSRGSVSTGRISKLEELDASLKSLMRDADEASRTLGENLIRRQREMEKVLSEFEGVESRVNKSLKTAEERQSKLDQQISRAQAVENALGNSLDNVVLPSEPRGSKSRSLDDETTITVEVVAETDNTQPFEKKTRDQRIETIADLEMEPAAAPEPPSFQAAVKKPARSAAQTAKSGLSGQVEKQISADLAMDQKMETVMRAADQAMKAGRAAARRQSSMSAARSPKQERDPLEGDKPYSPIVPSDQVPADAGEDPRLGVLGSGNSASNPIRRQIEVL